MSKRAIAIVSYLVTGLFYFSSQVIAEDKPAKEATPDYHVQKRQFQPELSLKGVIAPAEMEQVILRLKEYNGPLTVKSITPSGALVRKGEAILSIDTEHIERQLQEAIYKADKMKIDLEQAKIKMETDEANGKKELDKARVRLTNADEKLKNYKEIELPLAKDKEDNSIRRSEAYLEDRKVELEQLEEMYKNSEIAGKTKEIVLERARRDVEISTKDLALQHRDIDYNRQTTFPKQIENLTNEAKWAKEELGLLHTRTAMEITADQQALSNLEFELAKHTEFLARLKADKDMLAVKAAKDGIIVHGNLTQRLHTGKATSIASYEEMREGDTVKANETLFTIYSPDNCVIITSLPEASRYMVKSDGTAELHIKAIPDKTFKVSVSRIAALADEAENNAKMFSTQLTLRDNDSRLQTGLTCNLKFELNSMNNVIAIPADLIINHEGKSIVNLRKGEGTVEQEICVGASGGGEAWITSGLKEGDVIVPKK